MPCCGHVVHQEAVVQGFDYLLDYFFICHAMLFV